MRKIGLYFLLLLILSRKYFALWISGVVSDLKNA